MTDDPEFTADYPDAYKVELAIDLADGGRRTFFSDCPNGDPEATRYRDAPWLFLDDARTKAASVLAQKGFDGRLSSFQAAVEELPRAARLDGLSEILKAPPDDASPRPQYETVEFWT